MVRNIRHNNRCGFRKIILFKQNKKKIKSKTKNMLEKQSSTTNHRKPVEIKGGNDDASRETGTNVQT